MDKRRQGNREALTALKKVAPPRPGSSLPVVSAASAKRAPVERDSWMFIGNCFIQLPTNQLIDLIGKEQETIEEDIARTNKSLKKNIELLAHFEGLEGEFAGFNLSAITK